jgi:chromate transporter
MTVSVALLAGLAWRFALLSLFAIGAGVSVVIPQMHQEFVEQLHLLDARAFAEMLAISQAAPGPNFLLVPLVGWRIAAWPGAIVSLIAFLVLPMTITFIVGRLLNRHENATIRTVRRSFRPVTGGLWIAAGLVVSLATDRSPLLIAVTALVFIASLTIEISPLWWCLAAAVAGAVFAV